MDHSKSLQQLENNDWGEPNGAPTNMVHRCLELRRTPLNQLTAEDCRLLLGQKIGAPFLVPIALKFLSMNPMEGGHMLPGTLLGNVLKQPPTFWQSHPDLWWQVSEILSEVRTLREQIELITPAMNQFDEMGVD